MNRRFFAVALVLLIPALLPAQQPANTVPNANKPQSRVAARTAEQQMYEDIEVFRRILERKVKALYPAPAANYLYPYPINPGIWYNPVGMTGGSINVMGAYGGSAMGLRGGSAMGLQGGSAMGLHGGGAMGMNGGMIGMMGWNPNPYSYLYYSPPAPCIQLEGVYLKGQGVVYTVTLPSLQPTAQPKPSARKVSEWESVRRQVLDEKEKPAQPAKLPREKVPELKEVLLKAMADHGHHFKLAGNESLTIVITVRDHKTPSTSPNSGNKAASMKPLVELTDDRYAQRSAKQRELELLGDLNLKRGRYEEAIAAFQKAVELNPGPKQLAALYRKLAQTYLDLGQLDKARSALDKALALLKKRQPEKTEPKPAPLVPLALPSKLILSAPKALLSQAGEGKLTDEQFAAQAHVERVGPSR